MSPLTKLFVVLNVILSLVITAATVVFVSQVDDAKAAFNQADSKRIAAEQNLAIANQQAASAAAQMQENIRTTSEQLEQARQSSNQYQTRINDLSGQLAAASSQLALGSADQVRITEALKAAQDTNGKQSEQITAMRSTLDERLKQNVELNTTVTDLTDKNQVLERERRYLAEQLTDAKGTVDKQSSMLREAGINPMMAVGPAAAGSVGGSSAKFGAPPINGVIRARREIAKIPYATISVGANDGVTKGMEFKIIDRTSGNFLGLITIDSVEPTESTGRLTGPRLTDIRPGVEVRTQI